MVENLMDRLNSKNCFSMTRTVSPVPLSNTFALMPCAVSSPVDDKDDVSLILSEAKSKNFQIKDIIRAVAVSDLIRKR